MDNGLQLLIKKFEDKKVRTVWNNDEEKYYVSVVDIVSVLTESNDGRKYWNKLKQRLKEEGNETVTNCHQLKLKASDGKMRLTDVVDIEGMFRLIESIPSKKAEPIKLWLAHLGKERIDEEYDPEITINRAIEIYKRKGYSEEWINQRIKGINVRNDFTNELKESGIKGNKDFAIITDLLTKVWSGYTVKEYKKVKNIKKGNLRDNMSNLEYTLNMLAEVSSTEISKSKEEKNKRSATLSVIEGGLIAKNAKEELEKKIGKSVVGESVTNCNQLK